MAVAPWAATVPGVAGQVDPWSKSHRLTTHRSSELGDDCTAGWQCGSGYCYANLCALPQGHDDCIHATDGLAPGRRVRRCRRVPTTYPTYRV
eukprot:gene9981-8858_t